MDPLSATPASAARPERAGDTAGNGPSAGRGVWPAVLAGALVMVVAYLLVWQRGLFWDDYTNKDSAVDVVSGEFRGWFNPQYLWHYPARIVGIQLHNLLAASVPEYEFWARLGCAVLAGVNALLLGWLAQRLLLSRLAGIVAGWLFVAPFFAQEAVLWLGAAMYILCGTLTLLALHAVVSAIELRRGFIGWMLAATGLWAGNLLVAEPSAALAAAVPVLAVIIILRSQPRRWWARLVVCVVQLVAIGAVSFVVYWYFYRDSGLLRSRQAFSGVSISTLADRSAEFLRQMLWTYHSPWGHRLLRDAWKLGWRLISSTWLFVGVGTLMVAAVLLTIARFRESAAVTRVPRAAPVLLIIGGVATFFLTVLIPGVLSPTQALAARMLYFPSLAGCLAVAGGAWLIAYAKPREGAVAGVLVAAGLGACVSAVLMAGFARAFALRYQMDQQQVQALVRAIPPDRFRTDVYLVPFAIPGQIMRRGESIGRFLLGVFDHWVATAGALKAAYQRPIDGPKIIYGNRWDGITFSPSAIDLMGAQAAESMADQAANAAGVSTADSRGVPDRPRRLCIQGIEVDTDETIVFTYRQGEVHLIRELQLELDDGSTFTYCFPLVEPLIIAGACPLSIAVPADEPAFDFRELFAFAIPAHQSTRSP